MPAEPMTPDQEFEKACAELLPEGPLPPGGPRTVGWLFWQAAQQSQAGQVKADREVIDRLTAELELRDKLDQAQDERLVRDIQSSQARIERLEVTSAAGVAMYRHLQGGYSRCPICKRQGLRHNQDCPVDRYMRDCQLGPYAEAALSAKELPGER